jgi:hypothetical protein
MTAREGTGMRARPDRVLIRCELSTSPGRGCCCCWARHARRSSGSIASHRSRRRLQDMRSAAPPRAARPLRLTRAAGCARARVGLHALVRPRHHAAAAHRVDRRSFDSARADSRPQRAALARARVDLPAHLARIQPGRPFLPVLLYEQPFRLRRSAHRRRRYRLQLHQRRSVAQWPRVHGPVPRDRHAAAR